jgi:hypothetical protein
VTKEVALDDTVQLWVQPLIELFYRLISTQSILYWSRRLFIVIRDQLLEFCPDLGYKGLTLQYPSPLLSSTFLAILLSVLWPDPVDKAAPFPLNRKMDDAAKDRTDLPETIFCCVASTF